MIAILRADAAMIISDHDHLSSSQYPVLKSVQYLHENDDERFDDFIQNHVVREFCMRAIKDSPKGVLPLVLNFIASILQNVKYSFLPHVSIHKAVANLIFFASHYDSLQSLDSKPLHGIGNGNMKHGNQVIVGRSSASISTYKKRIGRCIPSQYSTLLNYTHSSNLIHCNSASTFYLLCITSFNSSLCYHQSYTQHTLYWLQSITPYFLWNPSRYGPN